jgi:hypothetical protein
MHLIIIFGPPAVGKMTVGEELSRLTGLPLFHNHLTIELALRFFAFEHPSFWPLVGELRQSIFQAVAAGDSAGMIFTYVWSLDDASDKAFIDSMTKLFVAKNAEVRYVELKATLDKRLERNQGESRLAAKPSKRDIARSTERMLTVEEKYRLNSSGDFFYPDQHIQIDNTDLPPEEVARQIVAAFALPTLK